MPPTLLSLKESSVCIVDAKGKVVREVKVASEPETLVRYFDELELPVYRIGLEAGPLSHWLHAGIGRATVIALSSEGASLSSEGASIAALDRDTPNVLGFG